MNIYRWLQEKLRNKTRDRICVALQHMGVAAEMAPRGCDEELMDVVGEPLGVIYVSKGSIRWVNVWKDGSQPTGTIGPGIGPA